MQARVVIRDMHSEEDFELTGDLTSRQLSRLARLAEQVAQDTDWGVTIIAEGEK